MKPTVYLRVFANPFACEVDHHGRPHAHLQYEPDLVNGDAGLRWIGCRCVAQKLRDADTSKNIRELYDHAFEYATEPVTVPVTAYYLKALAHGDLFAADAATHKIATGGGEGFRDPRARLAQLAEERKAIPALIPTAAQLAKGDERDAEEEWADFVDPPKAAAAPAFTHEEH